MNEAATPTVVIQPTRGWASISLREVWNYRELLWFLALRDLTVRYKQTALGAVWALLQPLSTVLVFTFFFGRVAKISSEGLPYPVFSMAGLLTWNLFVGCLGKSSMGLLGQANLITKIYFPRLVVPLSSILVAVPDVLLGGMVLAVIVAGHGVAIGPSALFLPVVLAATMASALGFGLWISALTVRYRDLQHVMGFLTQLWMYGSPVIYSEGAVTHRLEAIGIPGWLYGLNPAAGLVAATRALLFPQGSFPWRLTATSLLVSAVVLVSGAFYFRRTERTFADVI